MPVVPIATQPNQKPGREKQPVHDCERVARQLGPELGGVLALIAVRTEAGCRQEVRTHCHQRDEPSQRISADAASQSCFLRAEVLPVLVGVRHAHGGAVDAVKSEPAPSMLPRALVAPLSRALLEEPLHRLASQSGSRLGHATAGHIHWACARQHQVKSAHQLVDRPVSVQSHAQHEPNDLLGRQPPLAQTCCPRRLQGFLYPHRIDAGLQAFKGPVVCRRCSRERPTCHVIALPEPATAS